MRFNSLSFRLLLAALLVLPVFMLLTGLSLNQAFKDSQLNAEREYLRSQLYLILGATELEQGQITAPEYLSAPLFNQLQSGLYAFIQQDADTLWQSASAQSLSLSYQQQLPQLTAAGEEYFAADAIDHFFLYSYRVVWEELDQELEFQISVLHVKNTFYDNIHRFQQTLWQWLAIATVSLLLLLLAVWRWGLSPLRQLEEDVKAVEQGQSASLDGDYPQELNSLAENLNKLLEHESEQRQRYSNTLGDLAHSLKTPLAVMQGELQTENADRPLLAEQVQRMNDIVQHQLSRAVRGQQSLDQQAVQVDKTVARLLGAMRKVYAAKGLRLEQDIDQAAIFKGDERDLMEVLGNIIDNACKHAQQHIRIQASATARGLALSVEDDGQGLEADQQATILQRGVRLDSQQAGQGIGLAVVLDIVDSYGGRIDLQGSDLGGLRVVLSFDAA